MGTYTARVTSVVAIMAPLICFMLSMVASLGLSFCSWMMRITFSTTTMASSTSDPITRIKPNMVSTLMVYPSAYSSTNAPSRDTGMATAGISVARQSCRKT